MPDRQTRRPVGLASEIQYIGLFAVRCNFHGNGSIQRITEPFQSLEQVEQQNSSRDRVCAGREPWHPAKLYFKVALCYSVPLD